MSVSNPKSDFVSINGIRLHYLNWGGNGPVLIFLTGKGRSAYIVDKAIPIIPKPAMTPTHSSKIFASSWIS